MNVVENEKRYKISEIFTSFQGEGLYTGVPAVFIRFFGCNLKCNFGGKTEAQAIEKLEDFVVPERGCDSGYAWMEEMEHLSESLTVEEIVHRICLLSPMGATDLAIVYTGGEPLLYKNAILEIHEKLLYNTTNRILIPIIETNGTVPISEDFGNHGFHFSVSPKLNTVTNQTNGINFRSLESLVRNSNDDFILKFVLNNEEESWKELDSIIYRLENIQGDIKNKVYIMPMGADFTHQVSDETESIVLRAIDYGYKISLRTHIYVFKNKIGS